MPEGIDEVKLQVDVNDKASTALNSLAASIVKVTEAEKKLADASRKLAQDHEKFEQQKRAADVARKAEAAERESPARTAKQVAIERVKAQEFARAVDAEQRRLQRSAGGIANQVAGGARTLASGGLAGGLLASGSLGLMAAGAGMLAVDQAGKKVAGSAELMTSGIHSNAQKIAGLADEWIPLRSMFRKLGEAVEGTTERIAKSNRQLEVGRAVIAAQFGAAAAVRGQVYEYQFAEGTSRAYRGMGGPGGMPTFDRSSAIGARKSAESIQMLDSQDSRHYAAVQAQAARTAAGSQAAALAAAKANEARLFGDRQGAYKERRAKQELEDTTGVRDRAGVREALNKEELANASVTRANAQTEAEILRLKDAQSKAIAAESAYRKANIQVMQSELNILQQREDRMTGFAQKLGAMNEYEFEFAKEMLKEVKASGVENMPAELVDIAGQVAPEFIAKEREKLGEKRAAGLGKEIPGIDDSLVNEFQKDTLESVRMAVDKVRADIRVEIQFDAEQTANALTAQLAPLLTEFAEQQDMKIKLIRAEMERAQISKAQAER